LGFVFFLRFFTGGKREILKELAGIGILNNIKGDEARVSIWVFS
jgi:hypothetical protein